MLIWDDAEDLVDIGEAVAAAVRGMGGIRVVAPDAFPLVLGHMAALRADLRRRLRALRVSSIGQVTCTYAPTPNEPAFLDVFLSVGERTERLTLPLAGAVSLA